MIRESKTSPAACARSAAVGAGRLAATLPEAARAGCSACGAGLHAGARYCSDCGTAQTLSATDEAAAIHSRLGGSSADLTELLAANGRVVACPHCDELNKANAAYCGHCGEKLAAGEIARPATPADDGPPPSEAHGELRQARASPAASQGMPGTRFSGTAIALAAVVLGGAGLALALGRSPATPASLMTQSAMLRSVPTAPPAAGVASAAPVELVAALPAAHSPASGASREEQETPAPFALPPAVQERPAPPREGVRKQVAQTAVRRASASSAIDDLYRYRATQRCAAGLYGLICREALRFELCDGKWTHDAPPGMKICRLNR